VYDFTSKATLGFLDENLEGMLKDVGFVDISIKRIAIPVGGWSTGSCIPYPWLMCQIHN
jgi:hypothetical protein